MKMILYRISYYYMAEYIFRNEIIHTLTVLITTLYIVILERGLKMTELNNIIRVFNLCLSLNQAIKFRKIQEFHIKQYKI